MHSCHKCSMYHCFLFLINILSNQECQEGQSGLLTYFGNNLKKSIIVSMGGKNNYCPVNQLVKVCSFNPNLFLLYNFKTCRPLSGQIQSKNLPPPTVLFNPFQKLSGSFLPPPPTPHPSPHTRALTLFGHLINYSTHTLSGTPIHTQTAHSSPTPSQPTLTLSGRPLTTLVTHFPVVSCPFHYTHTVRSASTQLQCNGQHYRYTILKLIL